jgi:hypothetical protein
MPAKSKAQQALFGAIHAAQNSGDYSKLSPYAKGMAKNMSKKDVTDFAATKIKNLPNKVKKEELEDEYVNDIMDGFLKENKIVIKESESVLSLQNSFYRTTKESVDNFVKELQIAPDYKKNKIQYDEIILKIYRLFNSFDSKLRIIIKPITEKRLNAIGGNESNGEEGSPEKGPNI